MNSVDVVAGTAADLPEIAALLSEAGLPLAGLGEHAATDLFVVRDEDRLIAAGALERHGRDGLLRSVVVAPDRRGEGLGVRITDAAVGAARTAGLASTRLLTESAADFFEKRGFVRFDRADAPAALAASEEFAIACPASAVAMMTT